MMAEFENVKRVRGLIGRGVAVEHPDGKVAKHKIKSLKIRCDGDGFHVEGVELEMTRFDLNQFHKGFFVPSNDERSYFHPAFLYRSKGECAMDKAKSRIEQLEKSVDSCRKTLDDAVRTADSMKSLVESKGRELEALKGHYLKKKWFKEKTVVN